MGFGFLKTQFPILDQFPDSYEVFVYLLDLLLALLILFTIYGYWKRVRREREARSREMDQIKLWNRKEEYMSGTLCVGCLSPSTYRCTNCRAVPYCSEGKCCSKHWDQGHDRECSLMQGIEEFRESSFLREVRRNEDEYMADSRSAYCDSYFQWPNFDIYPEQSQPGPDAGNSTSEASGPQMSLLGPETSIASRRERFRPSWTSQSRVLACNEQCIAEHPLFIMISMSQGDWSSCKVTIPCSEHSRDYEWILGQRQEPQQVYGSSGEITIEGAGGLEHFEHAARRYGCSTFERGSLSSMYASDSDGTSFGSSDSDTDAMSSLHGS